ncbi:MAG TPA: nucleotidyltransferase family protein [Acidiferrobacterales bacterium]|nr:nucleotidyltransferase family protein [Acidiferrobacterales bacterium]
MRGIAGILLAAGCGSRFGANKLLAPLADGTPLAIAAARRLRSALGEVVAVVRPADPELSALLAAEGLRVVVCENAHAGMGASLAAGVAASREAHGWLIALADMPFIQDSTLQCAAQALKTGALLVAPFHAGRRGHPVGFHSGFRDELLALSGDAGARAILVRHATSLTRFDVDDAGVVQDVDTPADLAEFVAGQPVSSVTS